MFKGSQKKYLGVEKVTRKCNLMLRYYITQKICICIWRREVENPWHTYFFCLIKLNQYTNILSLIASITSIVRKWNCWRRRGMWLWHDWGLPYKRSVLWSNYLQAQTGGNLCDWTVLLQLHSEFNCLLINYLQIFIIKKNLFHSTDPLNLFVEMLTMSVICQRRAQVLAINVPQTFIKKTEVRAATMEKQQVGPPSSFYCHNYLHEIAIKPQQVIVLTACVQRWMLNVRKFGVIIARQPSVNASINLTRRARWTVTVEWIMLEDMPSVNLSAYFFLLNLKKLFNFLKSPEIFNADHFSVERVHRHQLFQAWINLMLEQRSQFVETISSASKCYQCQ